MDGELGSRYLADVAAIMADPPRTRLGLSMPAEAAAPTGVVFPEVDGRRSTSATGRAVADALRPVDPGRAAAAQRETNWRSGYLGHFRRLVEAGLARPEDAVAIAEAGQASVHDRMRWRTPTAARPASTPRSAGWWARPTS